MDEDAQLKMRQQQLLLKLVRFRQRACDGSKQQIILIYVNKLWPNPLEPKLSGNIKIEYIDIYLDWIEWRESRSGIFWLKVDMQGQRIISTNDLQINRKPI